MHRHGYRGTKFHRQRDQRRALLRSLADSLILNGSIETTLPKAKAVASYTEKLVGKAKKGKEDLHSRRQVIDSLATLEAAHKLVDELAPKLSGRQSGYVRIERTTSRRGDNAQMARISFVDKLKTAKESQAQEKDVKAEDKEEEPAATDVAQPKISETGSKISQSNASLQAPKRSGRRGNR